MNLRNELVDWLAALPAMETAEERRALLSRSGPASLCLHLKWDGDSHAFADRLLGSLARGGKAALSAFLAGLGLVPWLRDDAALREEVAAWLDRLAALDEAGFEAAFPPEEAALRLQQGVPDPGMLAAALAGEVLLPYYAVGASTLTMEAGEPAALLAEDVAHAVENALRAEPAAAALLHDLRYMPGSEHAELLAALAERLSGDPGLAGNLAGLLESGQEARGENALWSLLEVRQQLMAHWGETFAAAEPPEVGLEYSLPEVGDEDDETGKGGSTPAVPKSPAAAAPPPPPRAFESLAGHRPEDPDVPRHVETVEPGGTLVGAVIGGSGPVTVGGEHHHGDRIDTGGGTYVGGNVQVDRDLIGRDQVVHGDQVAGPKYEAGIINIFHGTPDTGLATRPGIPTSPLVEEAIRLDVAAPPSATLDLPFDLAVAVRQPDAPILAIEDLTQVKSQDGTVFRREEEEIVLYRVAVAAAACDVSPSHYILKLRPRSNSAPCWFQLTPHRPGKQSIVVTAYQQDDALAAQTRLSIEVHVPVSPGA
jgi:hypothetical protein